MKIERCLSKTERRGEAFNSRKNGGRGCAVRADTMSVCMIPLDIL